MADFHSYSVPRACKVALRSKRESDVCKDYEWRIDEALCKLDATRPINMTFDEYRWFYLQELRLPSTLSVRFAIDTLDGKHIGNCMYYDIDRNTRQAELGIMLGEKGYWGQGYGSDAVRLVLDHAFMEDELDKIYLHTLTDNLRAQGCFIKAGLKACGDTWRNGFHFLRMEILKRERMEMKATYKRGS